MSKLFVFTFTVTHRVQLSASQIWPDEPRRGKTAADARQAVEYAGGPEEVLRSWSLDRPTLSDGVPMEDATIVDVRLAVRRRRSTRIRRPSLPRSPRGTR